MILYFLNYLSTLSCSSAYYFRVLLTWKTCFLVDWTISLHLIQILILKVAFYLTHFFLGIDQFLSWSFINVTTHLYPNNSILLVWTICLLSKLFLSLIDLLFWVNWQLSNDTLWDVFVRIAIGILWKWTLQSCWSLKKPEQAHLVQVIRTGNHPFMWMKILQISSC